MAILHLQGSQQSAFPSGEASVERLAMQNLGKGDREGGGWISLKLLKTLIHLARQQEETTEVHAPD